MALSLVIQDVKSKTHLVAKAASVLLNHSMLPAYDGFPETLCSIRRTMQHAQVAKGCWAARCYCQIGLSFERPPATTSGAGD